MLGGVICETDPMKAKMIHESLRANREAVLDTTYYRLYWLTGLFQPLQHLREVTTHLSVDLGL